MMPYAAICAIITLFRHYADADMLLMLQRHYDDDILLLLLLL